jgi:2-polyprenyl-3-methyl-5-hydroxy-6-metoxy-1,4-benzoquinol methylase
MTPSEKPIDAQAAANADIVLPPAMEKQIRSALLETYFKWHPIDDSSSEADLRHVHDHVRGRFDGCRRWFMPWLRRALDLNNSGVVEIGCGTGSTTAALALDAREVEAYDIAGDSVEAARRRMQIMGLTNVGFHQYDPDSMLAGLRERHSPQTVDCFVLFAVLEHQLVQERLDTLQTCWNLLRPGGLLVVADTPNRLGWHDFHTSWLPFFDALPDDLALRYADRSPREDFRKEIATARARSEIDARLSLARMGRGVSYHEFELALGDVEPFIIGDGFDPEPLGFFGVSFETRMLFTYVKQRRLRVAPAFVRDTIEIILQKPGADRLHFRAPKGSDRSAEELEAIVRPLTP